MKLRFDGLQCSGVFSVFPKPTLHPRRAGLACASRQRSAAHGFACARLAAM